MIEPKRKPLEAWRPLMVVSAGLPFNPQHAGEHFIVNASRQAISRAMVSSRIEIKNRKTK